jgi:hypothetical protein
MRTVRIAVCGTHGSGKSTLVEDFLSIHRDYAHEPEPYEWLAEYGEEVGEPDAESFFRQLELSIARLSSYSEGARVIAERSPLDFLAYLLAHHDLGRSGRDCELIAAAAELAASGLAHLDLLVVLPLNDVDGIVAPPSEDLELRHGMNDRLMEVITTDPYSLLTRSTLRIVEIHGTPKQRLLALERAVAETR